MGSFLVPGSVGLQVKFVRFEVISVSSLVGFVMGFGLLEPTSPGAQAQILHLKERPKMKP